VARRGPSPAEVIAILHDAGGVASLAHPGVLRRDELIAPLAAAGLDALEALHSDHDDATEARYRGLARDLGLLVTGGSDFHGELQHRATRFGALSMSSVELDALRRAGGRSATEPLTVDGYGSRSGPRSTVHGLQSPEEAPARWAADRRMRRGDRGGAWRLRRRTRRPPR
jgi:hypothetical protein